MKKNVRNMAMVIFVLVTTLTFAQEENKQLVYKLNIKQEITKATWRQTQQAFEAADSLGADIFLIHMNTYGGTVLDADSIRTKILQSTIPVYVFIDNNAASAGALISIACDSIYMRPGGSIGAATVVNQTGQAMPDKYQSYMRSTMRATAEAHGKDTIITGSDTIYKWQRNPLIAEAMVDQSVYVEGISDTGKVLTFTPAEAIENGFCEGIAENIPEVLKRVGVEEYKIIEYEPSWIEKIIGWLVHPMISGLLIMAIVGGIYFEMQSPGIGFALGVAILAAVAYFAPLYLEGLAANWEIMVFVIGVILVGLEIFVIPGFGIAGISGVLIIFVSLVLSLIDNVNFDFENVEVDGVGVAITTVVLGIFGGFVLSLYLGNRMFSSNSGLFKNMALKTVQNVSDGFVSVETSLFDLKGKSGIAQTMLRPGGKVFVEGEVYDAVAENGYIEKDEKIMITKVEATQLYVEILE
ncbi:MAG: nodulation protein NfeD [Prolixibacteraceae bacterium]|jgi:membrane-bound serine protease (ClpP class)|nr:nodulation protein NfeD [Prolixibacteraceae bacterium]MBT6766798.1 nodulation protein NfeD [Prolixibacteraceae bacterium]MBT7000645.1 nodulation protein NfeD [Prolixibacteraceae bacterium]MBT7394365.1 nodulation protein NfeD [Prolixibacteraceae bacterium]